MATHTAITNLPIPSFNQQVQRSLFSPGSTLALSFPRIFFIPFQRRAKPKPLTRASKNIYFPISTRFITFLSCFHRSCHHQCWFFQHLQSFYTCATCLPLPPPPRRSFPPPLTLSRPPAVAAPRSALTRLTQSQRHTVDQI